MVIGNIIKLVLYELQLDTIQSWNFRIPIPQMAKMMRGKKWGHHHQFIQWTSSSWPGCVGVRSRDGIWQQ